MTFRRQLLLGAALGLAGFAVLPAVSERVAGQNLDMEQILRCPSGDQAQCGEARDLILNNCTVCHTFVPIVMQQFDEAGWAGLIDRHRPRVSQLSDDEVRTIQAYLARSFTPDMDPPELPPEMLENWTSY